VSYEDSRGVKWIELTHDILVDTVLASRRKREREVRERQTIKKWACVVGLTLLLGLVVALVQYPHAQDQRAKIIAQNQTIKLRSLELRKAPQHLHHHPARCRRSVYRLRETSKAGRAVHSPSLPRAGFAHGAINRLIT
jgi:hypothetical protein